MGAADLVPGISGGTVAFILGIYPRLIAALASFKPSLFSLWRKQGFLAVWLAVDANFLLSLLLGIATSVALLAHLLSYLLLHFPLHLNGVFFGLVAASAWVVAKEVNSFRLTGLLALVLGVLLASQLKYFVPALSSVWGSLSLLTYFLAGAIAICAMLLPGISGSFLLLSLGLYQPVIEALKTLNMPVIASFAAGALVGVLAFSQVLNWLLKNFKTATFAFLLGFILASLKNLWPWQELTSYRLTAKGELLPLETLNLLPSHYEQLTNQAAFSLSVSLLMLASFLVVIVSAQHNQG